MAFNTLDAVIGRFRFDRMPRRAELLACVDDSDLRNAVVAGHGAMDVMLGELIALMLPAEHLGEVATLSFPLKLDLSIVCGFLAVDSRDAFLAFMALRQSVIDESRFCVDKDDVERLFGSLSAKQHALVGDVQPLIEDGRHLEVFREILAALLFEVRTAYIERVKELLKRELARQISSEVLESADFRSADEQGMDFGSVVLKRVEETFKRITRDFDV